MCLDFTFNYRRAEFARKLQQANARCVGNAAIFSRSRASRRYRCCAVTVIIITVICHKFDHVVILDSMALTECWIEVLDETLRKQI